MRDDVVTMLGIDIDKRPLEALVDEALHAIDGARSAITFSCANPHSLVTARSDAQFNTALANANQVVADGVGVVLMARIAGIQAGPRITGSDYFNAVMSALNERGDGRIFFFGSSEEVLRLIAARARREFPRVVFCGATSPPYRAWSKQENDAMIAEINSAKPNVLWVGMTAPKQEKWVYENRGSLNVPVVGSIGAVFDFFAGSYPRAPSWMCRLGIEWVFRLIKEPKRMWRRNFFSTPKFMWMVFWNHVLLRR